MPLAQVIICEKRNDGDDEHWGWSVIDTTLQESEGMMTKEPNIQSLERSLALLSNNTEGPESEAVIQAMELVPSAIFACEASRGATDVLNSQQESPEKSPIPIVETLSHEYSLHFQAYAAKLEYPTTRSPDWSMDSRSMNHIIMTRRGSLGNNHLDRRPRYYTSRIDNTYRSQLCY